jgi:hypothetical protein
VDPNETLAQLRAAVHDWNANRAAAPAKNPPARKAGEAKSDDKYKRLPGDNA